MGGCCIFVLSGELKGNKKIENKIDCGLRWLPTGKSNTSTNQKHARATKDIGEVVSLVGSTGGVQFDCLGAINLGEMVKTKN